MSKTQLLSLSKTTIQLIDGDRGTNYPSKKDFSKKGFCLFLDSSNLTKNGFDFSSKFFITESKDHSMGNGKLMNDDLVMNTRGTIGNIGHYTKRISYKNIRINSGMLIIRGGIDFDNKFLYSFFRSNLFSKQVGNMMSGSVQNQLPIWAFNFIKVLKLDLPKQQKIAHILSTLDDKIEFNNRIDAELKKMAKTLYDYWFVQFDFPDANGKPYKTSGGKMVYNEILKREIPDGWNDLILEDIISRSGTGLNPRKNFKLGEGNNYYITIKNITDGRIVFNDKCDRVSDESLKIIDKRSDLQIGDVLFTSIQPVGVTYFIHEKPTNWNINESVFTIRGNMNKVTSEFLYMLLSSNEIKSFTRQSSTGSIHKGIRHGVLKSFKLPYGGKIITEEFANVISPILRKTYLLDKENQKLTELRDWILPMLMNGQVTVKDSS
jgi:type I restriction enzyme S subunit